MTRRFRLFALLLLLPFGSGPAAAPEPVILLTGFDAFGGRALNASWDAIAPLEGTRVGGALVHCVRLPVVWGRMGAPLQEALERWTPCCALCLGEGSPGKYRVEMVAMNQVAPHPDNLKALPGRTVVIEGAPESYPTALPVDVVVGALEKGSFPVERSENAGRYLCEECFFTLQHLCKKRGMTDPHGFLHVPPYPKDATEEQGKAHAEALRKDIQAVLEAIRK